MSRDLYRVRDYFNQLKQRQEITETEFRSLVELQVQRTVTAEPQSLINRTLMKTALILCVFLLGGGIFWYTRGETLDSQSQKMRSLHQQKIESSKQTNEKATTPIQLLPFSSEEAGENQTERSLFPPLAGHREGRQEKDLTPALSQQGIPWGYHFVPGQKLWYELTFDQNDIENSEDFVATNRATVEIEAIDSSGNITLLLTTEQIKTEWRTKEMEERFKGTREFKGERIFRATITPLGQFINGEVINDPSEQEWMEQVNSPDFGGGMRPLPSSRVRFHVERWFPLWPERKSFDKEYTSTRSMEKFDTVQQIEMGWYDDASRHLDTVGSSIFYASAQSRGIIRDGKETQKEKKDFGGIVAYRIGDKTGQTAQEATEEKHAQDAQRENPPISREREYYRYKLQMPDSFLSPDRIHLTTSSRKENCFDSNKSNDCSQWKEEGDLQFRKSDGGVTEYHNRTTALDGESKARAYFISTLRLLRSELPPIKLSPESPTIR